MQDTPIEDDELDDADIEVADKPITQSCSTAFRKSLSFGWPQRLWERQAAASEIAASEIDSARCFSD